ncbi:hypothetical protein PoB_004932700 [Plakobranchus ocellatus]|uniref:Uncharacterized protein n=1 Tax=Plakobranchus ocellatus TaxID=259542 RepID=A0AAV4BTU4_9GAST|nr:hypothetical protein PoB_004932700 [Plakobranchus ocellatus]
MKPQFDQLTSALVFLPPMLIRITLLMKVPCRFNASGIFMYIASPQQCDLTLSDHPSVEGAGGGARTRDRRVAADLRDKFDCSRIAKIICESF